MIVEVRYIPLRANFLQKTMTPSLLHPPPKKKNLVGLNNRVYRALQLCLLATLLDGQLLIQDLSGMGLTTPFHKNLLVTKTTAALYI